MANTNANTLERSSASASTSGRQAQRLSKPGRGTAQSATAARSLSRRVGAYVTACALLGVLLSLFCTQGVLDLRAGWASAAGGPLPVQPLRQADKQASRTGPIQAGDQKATATGHQNESKTCMLFCLSLTSSRTSEPQSIGAPFQWARVRVTGVPQPACSPRFSFPMTRVRVIDLGEMSLFVTPAPPRR